MIGSMVAVPYSPERLTPSEENALRAHKRAVIGRMRAKLRGEKPPA